MNNLKLKNKILLILALPIIAILILSSSSIYDKFEKENNMTRTSNYIDFTVKISNLLTSLQKERELSISYLDSYGKDGKVKLDSQIELSNQALNSLNIFLEDFNLAKTDTNLLEKISVFKNNILKIKETRSKLIELKINSIELIDYFSNINMNLISFFDDLLIYSSGKDLSKSSQAYVALINIIEKTYSEKNIVKNIFHQNLISNEDYNNFLFFVSSQNSYLDIFMKNLSTEQLEFYKKEITSSSFKDVNNFRELIYIKMKKESFLSEIKDAIGYGGLIHSYKDYVLEQNDKDLNKIQKNHTKMLKAIKNYKKLENITDEENVLLNQIQETFDFYMSKAYEGSDLALSYIDDSKALKAIVTLSKMLFLRDHQQLWARTSCVLGLVIGILLILGVIYFAPDYYIPKFALFITIFNAAIFSALSLRIEC